MKRILLLLAVFGITACDTEGEIIQGRTVSSIAPHSGAAGGHSPVVGGVYYDSAAGLTISQPGNEGDILVMSADLEPIWTNATPEAALPITGGALEGNLGLNGNYISYDGSDVGIYIDPTGKVGVGTGVPVASFHVVGDAVKTAGGTTWNVISDARLKQELGVYDKGLKDLERIQVKSFKYLAQPHLALNPHTTEYGVMAQELLSVFPEAVGEHSGYYVVNYHPIQMASLNAIKELAQKNRSLEKKLSNLEAKLEKLLKNQEVKPQNQ